MKGKARRLLSWVCVLALCMSLLPVTALASGTNNGSAENTYNDKESAQTATDVTANKTVTDNENGTYTVTLSVQGYTDSSTTTKDLPADIVLVVDTSTSMNDRVGSKVCGCTKFTEHTSHWIGTYYTCDECDDVYYEDNLPKSCTNEIHINRLDVAKDAAKTFVNGLLDSSNDVRIGLFDFSGSNRTNVALTNSRQTLIEEIEDLYTPDWGDGTYYNVGLKGASNILKKSSNDRQKFVVFLSDGEPSDRGDGSQEAADLKQDGVTIFTVGIDIDSEYDTAARALKKISSEDKEGNKYFYKASSDGDSGNALRDILEQIKETIPSLIYAGKNAVMTDEINTESFEFVSADNGLNHENGTLTWNIDDITGTKETVSFTIKPKEGNTATGEVHTNKDVSLSFDSTKTGTEVTFEKGAIGDPTVPLYSVTYTDGVAEEVFSDQTTYNLRPGSATPAFDGTPKREGYTFVGWNDGETTYEAGELPKTVSGNVTYTAQWKNNMTPTANDITIEVVLDGNTSSPISGGNVDTYIDVNPYQNASESGDEGWNPGHYNEGKVTYDITYYDCKDIGFAAKGGYVIEAIDADLVYGQSGCHGIYDTSNPPEGVNEDTVKGYGDYMADNVKGGSTVTVYVRSAYTVEYYQDRAPLSGGSYDDTTQYVAETTALTPTSATAQNPTDTGYYHVDCGCNNPEECEHKGYTNASGGQPETNYIKTFEQKDEITLPDLPTKANYTVTGWYLTENGTGDTKSGIIPVYEVAGNADNDRVIKFYSKSTVNTADYTVEYVFLDKNGDPINDTGDWTSDVDTFPQGGDANIGDKVGQDNLNPQLPNTVQPADTSDNYFLESCTECTITAETDKNVITVTYALDNWNDKDDTETGGDNTPDYQQALIKYVVADGQSDYGQVNKALDVVTLEGTDGAYSGSATASATASVKQTGWAFDNWSWGTNNTSYAADLSDTFTAQGGQTYTYTANFAEDKNGDGTPDKYQVFVNFVSANDDQGEVSTKDDAEENTGINQVYTLTDEAGHYVTKGNVTPSLDGVEVTAEEDFVFTNSWTKDDEGTQVDPTDTLENINGGTTITFYAHFTAVEKITIDKKLVMVNDEDYSGTGTVTSGNVLTYQITVQNTGGADAKNDGRPFVLTDTLWKDGTPDNYQVTFTDAQGNNTNCNTNGDYDVSGGSVSLYQIPAHSKYVFTYTYTVQLSDEGKALENTAVLAYNADETIEDTVTVDVEKTHCIITYKYESGTADKDLPDDFPAAPGPQTLNVGDEVPLPTPGETKIRVDGGIWTFLGWRSETGDNLNPPIIARVDMTIIGLWTFSEAYTLTYDANGGNADSVPTDSTAYTEGQTTTLTTEPKPTHAQAETPEGSVITDEKLVDVVFIGWSTTQTNKIFAAGEDYGDVVSQVTFKDQDITVYAVWGYDENGDGIADAQQIVITPADITIYTGGQSYDGIVEGENGEIAENNGMPEPGFYFILPYELDNELGGRGNTEDLTGKLRLHYENGDDIRTWDLALYNEEAGTANKVYGKYYIYRLKPVNNNDLVVRVEIQDGDRLVTSDQFDISLNGELYKEYTMTLYTNSVEQNLVTAQTNVDGTGTDWTPRDTQGIALGTGTLTIRGTNDEAPVSPIQGDVIAPVEEITAKAAEGTEYTINDSNLPVVNQDAVQLLNDSLVEGSTDALKDAIVDEAATDDSVTITEDYQFDFCYLDLVDTSNGNAYATTNQPLEIYWPYPDGTNQDTTFYIAHFDGLDREFDPNNLENELNGAELKIYSANTDNSDLKLENTEQGIKISTSTFSPFVLVYNQKDAAAPSLTVDKELTAVNGKTPGSSVSVGDTLTYTITVKNGEVALNNVTITDTFNGKGDLVFDGYTATENPAGTYTINLGNLTAGQEVTITATYKVLRGDANGTLTNAVSVTGTPTDGGEPTTGGDTEKTPVNPYHPPIRPPEDPDKPELNTEDHYAYIVGYEDGSVQPEGDITRAEVATIFFRLLTDESRNEYWSQTNPYSDVSADDWFNNAVSTLTNAGVLDGYEDGTFKPNGNITRAEFATITARFFEATYDGENLFPDIEGHWAQDYINEAANAGIVNGYEDGTFRPQQYITRAEAVTMVNRTIERHPDADHLLDDMIVWPDNPETAWYYEQIQEATNSHEYTMNTDDEQNPYEIWTKLLPNRDWSELEKEWSDANDGAGSGEVV